MSSGQLSFRFCENKRGTKTVVKFLFFLAVDNFVCIFVSMEIFIFYLMEILGFG